MTIKEKEIKNKIWSIWKILLLSKDCYKISFLLYKPETKEQLEYISSSQYFLMIRVIVWRYMVIELSKIFSSNKKRDKYNLLSFIDNLKPSGYYSSFKISSDKIEDWISRIIENKSTIEKILFLRDNDYAHSDFPKKASESPSFEQTKELIKIVENVVQEIYASVFDSHAMMEDSTLRPSDFDAIQKLTDLRLKETEYLRELLRRSKS